MMHLTESDEECILMTTGNGTPLNHHTPFCRERYCSWFIEIECNDASAYQSLRPIRRSGLTERDNREQWNQLYRLLKQSKKMAKWRRMGLPQCIILIHYPWYARQTLFNSFGGNTLTWLMDTRTYDKVHSFSEMFISKNQDYGNLQNKEPDDLQALIFDAIKGENVDPLLISAIEQHELQCRTIDNLQRHQQHRYKLNTLESMLHKHRYALNTLEHTKATKEGFSKDIKNQEDRLNTLESMLQTKATKDSVTKHFHDYTKTVHTVSSNLRDYKGKLQTLNTQVQSNSTVTKQMTEQLHTIRQQQEDHHHRLEHIFELFERFKQSHWDTLQDALQTDMEARKVWATRIDNTVEQCLEHITTVQKECKALQEQVMEYQPRVKCIEDDLVSAQSTLETIQNDQTQEATFLSTLIRELQQTCEESAAKWKAYTVDKEQFQQQIETNHTDMQNWCHTTLSQENKARMEQLEQRDTEVTTLQHTCTQLQHQMSQYEQTLTYHRWVGSIVFGVWLCLWLFLDTLF